MITLCLSAWLNTLAATSYLYSPEHGCLLRWDARLDKHFQALELSIQADEDPQLVES